MSCLLPIFSTFGCSPKGWWFEPTQGRTPFHGRELTNCLIIFILPCVDTIYQGIGIDDKTMGALCLLLSVDVFQDSFFQRETTKSELHLRMWTLHASLKTRDWIYFNFLEHCRLKIFVFIKLCYKENILYGDELKPPTFQSSVERANTLHHRDWLKRWLVQ